MTEKNPVHTGHRDRLRNRFLNEGIDGFHEINALELLLFYCVPRKDTNELAHKLLEHFGSYSNVLDAPVSELKKIDGVSDYVATYLNLQGQLVRYYLVNRNVSGTIVQTTEDYGTLLLSYFTGRRNETVFMLCLDAKCKVICCREITEGSVNAASISVRKIVDIAISSNASSVVLAHNHPSGLAFPSNEDVRTTLRIKRALEAVDVILVDHIVVSDHDYISLLQSGYYNPKSS